MYVCELCRVCVSRAAESKYLFQGEVPANLKIKGSFLPEYVYDIEK